MGLKKLRVCLNRLKGHSAMNSKKKTTRMTEALTAKERITPGMAEGDLETVEANLRKKEHAVEKKKARRNVPGTPDMPSGLSGMPTSL